MKKITQEELDWFAEGELDSNDREILFARLDQEPGGWKRCALALLERDALRGTLPQAMTGSDNLDGRVGGMASGDLEPQTVSRRVVDENPFPARRSILDSLMNVVLAAAIAGLLLTTGYWIAGQPSQDPGGFSSGLSAEFVGTPFSTHLAQRDLQAIQAANSAMQRISVSDSQLLAFVSVMRNSERFLLPVIESELLAKQIREGTQPALPAAWTRKMKQAGWQLDRQQEFLSVHHPNGENELLPMNLLNCRYVGREVF